MKNEMKYQPEQIEKEIRDHCGPNKRWESPKALLEWCCKTIDALGPACEFSGGAFGIAFNYLLPVLKEMVRDEEKPSVGEIKYLSVNMKFILPNDFEGDLPDAIVTLAEHLRERLPAAKIGQVAHLDKSLTQDQFDKGLYDYLMDRYLESGERLATGQVCFAAYDVEKKAWSYHGLNHEAHEEHEEKNNT